MGCSASSAQANAADVQACIQTGNQVCPSETRGDAGKEVVFQGNPRRCNGIDQLGAMQSPVGDIATIVAAGQLDSADRFIGMGARIGDIAA